MNKIFFKTLALSFMLASSTFVPSAFAADNKNNAENIDVTPDAVSDQELAAIYVLFEICPALIGKDLKFNKAYENLVKAHLSNSENAVETLNKRTKTKAFKPILEEARQDAQKASDDDNRQICHDVRDYFSK